MSTHTHLSQSHLYKQCELNIIYDAYKCSDVGSLFCDMAEALLSWGGGRLAGCYIIIGIAGEQLYFYITSITLYGGMGW